MRDFRRSRLYQGVFTRRIRGCIDVRFYLGPAHEGWKSELLFYTFGINKHQVYSKRPAFVWFQEKFTFSFVPQLKLSFLAYFKNLGDTASFQTGSIQLNTINFITRFYNFPGFLLKVTKFQDFSRFSRCKK